MRQSKLRAVAGIRPWLLLCLALAQAATATETSGFISIDCGFPGTTSYVDDTTTLSYAPDAAFADAGENYNISAAHVTPGLARIYHDVRSFADGARNCYTLRSLAVGLKYLLRATFMYGNYDGLNRPPVFDLYIGVNLWKTVNVSDYYADPRVVAEAIVVVPDDFVQVCLVNTGSGTPFISGLELRPLKSSIYPQVNETQGLVLVARRNFGPTDSSDIVRYPDDPYDRVWTPIIDATDWAEISTTETVQNEYKDLFEAPSKVMQTAITPRDAANSINFHWDSKPQSNQGPSLGDLTGNQLSGSIPPGLLKKIQDGSLNLIYADNPNLCTNGDSCQTAKGKSKLAIYVAVPMALVVVALTVLLCCLLPRRNKRGSVDVSVKPRDKTLTSLALIVAGGEHRRSSLRLENRRFTYEDLEMITNNFQRVIGRGGFGYVYEGFLEDGTQVAVKMRSQSSNQGAKEFLTEAQILTRIHHKNLVSMIGYCKDGVYMALVYEYMSEGSLQEHISVKEGDGGGRLCLTLLSAGKHLTWGQRLRIALESAQGLEYLHKGCNPPLIHRDVKTSNILLNAKLEAKVADFGLSKALDRDIYTHASTNTLVGTPGYVDPEYQATMQPTTKSDVYSFGVVLLELVTGRLPILQSPQPTSVIQWTRQRLARGDIEGVVDASMGGNHDVNSVWKATEIALQCTEQASSQRPTMTDVVAQLLDCLDLEKRRIGGDANESFFSSGDSGDTTLGYNAHVANHSTDVSQSSALEMVPMMAAGPATR